MKSNDFKRYFLTRKQLKFVERIKGVSFPGTTFASEKQTFDELFGNGVVFDGTFERDLLRYLGGDESVIFVISDPMYRLHRVDDDGDDVYMSFNDSGTPSWTLDKGYAYVDSLDEIKKWHNPSYEIEPVE